jgi:hypothetical protein
MLFGDVRGLVGMEMRIGFGDGRKIGRIKLLMAIYFRFFCIGRFLHF